MATRKTRKKPKPATAAPGNGRLLPPPGGAVVRMYRIGHGDCFLIAFAGEDPSRPSYVLIDCGYKPGSPAFLGTTVAAIGDDLRAATGGRLDVVIVTHEHQDHVNGITSKTLKDLEIGQGWFAWTENPRDEVANDLRKKFEDKLLGLLAARNRIAAAGSSRRVDRIDELLAFEFGGEDVAFNAAAVDPVNSRNKQAMDLVKQTARRVRFLRPHDSIVSLPGAESVRVFVLGPPRDPALLASLDPEEGEQFHLRDHALGSVAAYFGAAAKAGVEAGPTSASAKDDCPFANRYRIPWDDANEDGVKRGTFYALRYGKQGVASQAPPRPYEVESNPEWRRIDKDWLYSAEQLALDMNDQTNNSSLVLAFELGKGGKVLLFAADAQRGSWVSWARKSWRDGAKRITAKELLARTVLYKVGHHGSHNATLNGLPEDPNPNLSWMGLGDGASEFTAMITAVRAWAETQKGWDHPLKAIKDALLRKCSGRVFQTDTDFGQMKQPKNTSDAEWSSFTARTAASQLFFDYRIEP